MADALDLGSSGELSEEAKGQDVPADSSRVLASCLAFLAEKSPDLAMVIKAWPELPEAVRKGILAMVGATSPGGDT